MEDRETVITHLQIIHTWAEFARERDLQFFTAKHLEDIAQWADDALALIDTQYKLILELQNLISIGTKMMNGDDNMNARQAARAAAKRIDELEYHVARSKADIVEYNKCISHMILHGSPCDFCEDIEECKAEGKDVSIGCDNWMLHDTHNMVTANES